MICIQLYPSRTPCGHEKRGFRGAGESDLANYQFQRRMLE